MRPFSDYCYATFETLFTSGDENNEPLLKYAEVFLESVYFVIFMFRR